MTQSVNNSIFYGFHLHVWLMENYFMVCIFEYTGLTEYKKGFTQFLTSFFLGFVKSELINRWTLFNITFAETPF